MSKDDEMYDSDSDDTRVFDAPLSHATTALTVAEINKNNKKYWAPSYGESAGEGGDQTHDTAASAVLNAGKRVAVLGAGKVAEYLEPKQPT